MLHIGNFYSEHSQNELLLRTSAYILLQAIKIKCISMVTEIYYLTQDLRCSVIIFIFAYWAKTLSNLLEESVIFKEFFITLSKAF